MEDVSVIKKAAEMNVEHLLTHFDRIADAPDAIPRLRRFILDLAVRGKLVPQDPNDEPASELLKRIAAEKARLVKLGQSKKQKAIPALAEEELPFTLPSNWKWSQIAEIGVLNPRNEVTDDAPASFVPMSMIAADYGVAPAHEVRRWGEIKKGYTHFAEGDVGLAKITPCFENGKSTVFQNLAGGLGSGTTELHIVRPLLVDPNFIILFFKSSHFIETGIPKMTGTAGQKRVPTEYFANAPFPLPPLAEQHRIVAKVDELMTLCDRLEAARIEREATRDRMATASLARLNAPEPDPAIFQNHAAFALNNLTPLTTRPDQIKALRQTILNLAVRGKLVPQDPNDEPASELLKRIALEKKQLVEMEKMRDIKPTVEELKEKFVRQLPPNWSMITISQIAYLRSGIALEHGEEQAIGDIPYLKVADLGLIENDKGIITSSRFVGQDRKDAAIESGSIVFPKRGGAIATNRKRRSHVNVVCDSNIMAMKPFVNDLLPFLELWFSNLDLWRLNSGTSVPQINNKDIYPLSVLLPPLAEQHRIVAKVDELIALCDQLETSVATRDDTRSRLLDALLHEALAPNGKPTN